TCVYELLPPDPRRGPYRLTVELRHSNSSKGTAVGLYIGRQEHVLAQGVVQTFVQFGFVEPELLRLLHQQVDDRARGWLNVVSVEPRREEPPRIGFLSPGPNVPLPASPRTDKMPWRTLIVESRRDSIAVRFGTQRGVS